VACDDLGFSMEKLKQRILAAGQAAFLPEAERQELVETLKKELK
jgi:hypothetical protein